MKFIFGIFVVPFIIIIAVAYKIYRLEKRIDLLDRKVSDKTGESIEKVFKLLDSRGKTDE